MNPFISIITTTDLIRKVYKHWKLWSSWWWIQVFKNNFCLEACIFYLWQQILSVIYLEVTDSIHFQENVCCVPKSESSHGGSSKVVWPGPTLVAATTCAQEKQRDGSSRQDTSCLHNCPAWGQSWCQAQRFWWQAVFSIILEHRLKLFPP